VYRDGRIRTADCQVQRWLGTYFCTTHDKDELPTPLRRWLRGPARLGQPYTVVSHAKRLLVTLVEAAGSATVCLAFQELPAQSPILIASTISSLTGREASVALGVKDGKSTREIAAELQVKPSTIRKHLQHIFSKLEVHSRIALIAKLHPIEKGGRAL
jgi:DNA-binding CsgD family transcriptional regulator